MPGPGRGSRRTPGGVGSTRPVRGSLPGAWTHQITAALRGGRRRIMTPTRFGPVDLVAIGLEGDAIPGTVQEAVSRIAASGSVTLLDVALVHRDAGGSSRIVEAEELATDEPLASLPLAAAGLIGDEDLDAIAQATPPGSSALVVLLENTWARELVGAAESEQAFLIAAERIPAEVVNEIAELANAGA